MKTKGKTSGPNITCPVCGAPLSPKWVRRASGRLVGAIKGKSKAHSPEVARANVMVRWAKAKASPNTK